MSRKKSPKKLPPKPAAPVQAFGVIRVLLGVALLVSGFLAWQAFQSGAMPGCGPESGCDRVLNSRWSRALGLPVSIYALVVYALMLGETLRKQLRWVYLSALASVTFASILWFLFLQVAVVKAFCAYCMVAHVAGGAASILLLRRVPARLPGPIFAGAGVAALFAAVQAVTPAPAPKQIEMAGAVSKAEVPRFFSILGGQFRFDLAQVPVSGDLGGTNRVVKLFDYTCHHCRDLHHLLKEYERTNAITVISLPVPLDPNCNAMVNRPHPDHLDACEYARSGLAVFYAKPDKFEQFSDWLFGPGRPYALAEARAYAASLVGSNEFNAALRDARIEQQLKTNIAVYIASSKNARTARMPQLIFQNSASVGAVADLGQLQRIMAANFSNTNVAGR